MPRPKAGDAGRSPRVRAEEPSLSLSQSSGRRHAREVAGGRTGSRRGRSLRDRRRESSNRRTRLSSSSFHSPPAGLRAESVLDENSSPGWAGGGWRRSKPSRACGGTFPQSRSTICPTSRTRGGRRQDRLSAQAVATRPAPREFKPKAQTPHPSFHSPPAGLRAESVLVTDFSPIGAGGGW